MTKGNNKDRLTVRLDNYTMLKLSELSESLNTSYSLLIRSIINNWISDNEEKLNEIIDKNSVECQPSTD